MATYAEVQGAIFNAQPIPFAGGQNLLKGEKAPYAVPCVCDFAASNIPAQGFIIDPSRLYNSGAIRSIQSIFFDNSANNSFAYVTVPGFSQVFALPGGWQGYFAILAPVLSGGVMYVTSPLGTGKVTVLLLNTYFTTQQWAATVIAPAAGATIPVADAILDATVVAGRQNVRTTFAQLTSTDRSGTIAVANTSQQLAAANANRQGLEIQNIDGVNIEGLWYNPSGGAAVVGGVGSFELAAASDPNYPGGSVKLVTSNQVNIIAATAGHKFSAIEY